MPKNKLEEDIKTMQERIDDLKSSPVLKELNDIFTKGLKIVEPHDFTGAVKGRHSLHQQLSTMFKDADKKINILTTPEGLKELYDQHYNVLKKASDKGVDIKIAISDMEKCVDTVKALNVIEKLQEMV